MQRLQLVRQNFLNQISYRAYSTSPSDLFRFAVGKVKKFIYGSENPYNSRDLIYEQMVAEGKNPIMRLYMKKMIFARKKARVRIVKHNERIRKLEDKIQGDVYKTKSFQNRF